MAETALAPTPEQVADATDAEEQSRDALEDFAEKTLGRAVGVLTGLCQSLDTTAQTMVVQRDDSAEGDTFTASWADRPVTATVIGRWTLSLEDPTTRKVYFRLAEMT